MYWALAVAPPKDITEHIASVRISFFKTGFFGVLQ
jgi:hypothetical protein